MVPQQQRRRRRRVVSRAPERRVVVARGVGGFGFTIAGQRPCVVSAVAAGGPADRAGLRAGDALLAVDGANVARAPHASVARLVAAAPGAIALTVAPRESAPTDTEDTEPDERARTRRRHPPPRRRPQAMLHHPGCHAAPSTSGMNEILHNLSRAQLTPNPAARLECRAVVGYLGTIDTPQAAATAAPGNVRTAVRRLRQERRPATPVLLSVLPNSLLLRRPNGQILAKYLRERIVYAGCGSDADPRYFGLVTSAETAETEASHSCHVFAVDPRTAEHEAHSTRAAEFQITCTRDHVAERCLEFPPSAEYVVGIIRGMYSLPPDEYTSPNLQISKLAVKGVSPAASNFSRCNRGVFRMLRDRRPCRNEDARVEGPEFVANSPQPSNHSEMTTTSSNSDSGIGFNNDCRNIADRILVVDFAGQPPLNRFRQEMPRRPVGMVGCSSFDADGSFLSNTTPVVDGFGGQGRPLNLDDVILNANDLQPVMHISPRAEEDNYNYNNAYGNVPSTSRSFNGVYDQGYTENEVHNYEMISSQLDYDLDSVDTFNSVEMYEERSKSKEPADHQSNESVENMTVISGGTSKASVDSVSVYSSRSHEDARTTRRHQRHLQASLDDMLVLGLRDPPPVIYNDDDNFVHPGSVKCKVRKSKPLNLLSKTKHMLTGKSEKGKKERRRAISASAENVCESQEETLPAAASEPDLREQSEQSSPFRRWTTSNGAGNSYRHRDHRSVNTSTNMAEAPKEPTPRHPGGVAHWAFGLDHLLADPYGAAAFTHFLAKEYSHENIKFWWACEQYRLCTDPEVRRELALEIWNRHLSENASEPVNIDAAARRNTQQRMEITPTPPDVFEQAQHQIYAVMKFDSYPRFLRSEVHSDFARADLCGVPPPYPVRGPDGALVTYPPPRGASATPNTPTAAAKAQDSSTRLKKSASNVSERRRSAASLLPWRARGASRDRAQPSTSAQAHTETQAQSPPPPPSQAARAAVVDVVKSSQAPGCSLCRVVLPDGATSVVEVDSDVTVKRLVDRLLHRRNLVCNAYDVIVKDGQGECRVVDSSNSSLSLGGREAVVERRIIVRLEVGSRCVAVRCGAARRLRHVLRPVLARYCGGQARAVCRDGVLVHPDTSMVELDGARLQVVDLTEGGEFVKERTREEDVDSLSDLALRIQDDKDDQSTNSLTRSEVSSIGSSAGSSLATGRVRAALRPGPPVHHHPPDFLENLRETQRQRLQNKSDPAPPRTPPPLPPKPPQRQAPPTVV